MQWGGEMKGTLPGTGKVTVTWQQTWQLPDQVKDVQEVQIQGMKLTKIQVFNREQAWVRMNGQTRELKGEERDKMLEELYPERFDKLYPLKDKGYDLSPLEEVKIAGRAAVGIKVAAKGHRDVKLYFDKESGLLVKRENQIANEMGKLVALELFYSDYQEVEGLKLYRKIMAYVEGKEYAEVTITAIKFFDKLDGNVFAKP
jgi:hypothetical protein